MMMTQHGYYHVFIYDEKTFEILFGAGPYKDKDRADTVYEIMRSGLNEGQAICVRSDAEGPPRHVKEVPKVPQRDLNRIMDLLPDRLPWGRQEIARITNLRPTVVSLACEQLAEAGLIEWSSKNLGQEAGWVRTNPPEMKSSDGVKVL